MQMDVNSGVLCGLVVSTLNFDRLFQSIVDLFVNQISRYQAVRFFREENPANVGRSHIEISSAGGFNANPSMAYYNASKLWYVPSAHLPSHLLKDCLALEGFSEALSKGNSSGMEHRVQCETIYCVM